MNSATFKKSGSGLDLIDQYFPSSATDSSSHKRDNAYLLNRINSLSIVINSLVQVQKDNNERSLKAAHKANEALTESKKLKENIIEILGIFVAIFTFISVEIVILKSATNFYELLGLSLILIGGISFLLSWVTLITEKKFTQQKQSFSKYFLLLGISFVLLFAGSFIGISGQKMIKENEDYSYQQQIKDLNKKLNSTNETIDLLHKHIQVMEKLNNLENQIE